MDVVNAEQAKIAEDAGAVAVMALERVPADIRRDGGVARMSDPALDRRDPGRRHDPGHGQGPHRPLRRGAGAGSARSRLHRRERSAHPSRRGAPHRQMEVPGPLRLRRHEPRGGAPPDVGGCGHHPLEGRGRHGQRRRGGPPPSLHPRRHPQAVEADSAELYGWAKKLGAPSTSSRRSRRRAAARAAVLRRGHRHSGRRRARDAARSRGRVRRLGNLQEHRPGSAWRGPSWKQPPTSRMPRSSPRCRTVSATPWPATRSARSR